MKLLTSVSALFFSRACVAVASFLLVPAYLDRLGVAALGLISLLLSIQACMMVFDLGLTTTATTRAATLGEAQKSVNTDAFLKSSEYAYWAIGGVFASVVALLAVSVSGHWSSQVIKQFSPPGFAFLCLMFGCASLALTWPQNFYAAVLNGFQHQKRLAWIVSISAALKLGVCFAVLLFVPNLLALFVAFFACAMLQTLWMRHAVARGGEGLTERMTWASFKHQILKNIDKNLLAIAAIGTVLAQGDKIFLSTLLSSTDFATYAVAAMLCACMYMLINPLYSTLLPYFVQQLSQKDETALLQAYIRASELAALLIVPAGLALVVFAPVALQAWLTNQTVAAAATPVLIWLAIGTTAHGLLYVPFALQMAANWTSLALKMNMALFILLIPALYWSTKMNGMVGAAMCWACMNVFFLVTWPALMHRRLLVGMAWWWALRYVLVPLFLVGLVMSFLRIALYPAAETIPMRVGVALLAYFFSVTALAFWIPSIRTKLMARFKRDAIKHKIASEK